MKRSAGSRSTTSLSESVQHQLHMYALAASAAGVSLLTLVQPSEGKIVYHRVQFVIDPLHTCHLDLNHDGVTDFTLRIRQIVRGTWYYENFLSAVPARNNGVVGQKGQHSATRIARLAGDGFTRTRHLAVEGVGRGYEVNAFKRVSVLPPAHSHPETVVACLPQ